MPVTPTYPGVYMQEIPSGVHTIVGVSTSITAFIGRAARGPVNVAVTINSFADFERMFGGLWSDSRLGYAVRDFYLNGGGRAVIVRLFHPRSSQSDEIAQPGFEIQGCDRSVNARLLTTTQFRCRCRRLRRGRGAMMCVPASIIPWPRMPVRRTAWRMPICST
ncbi:MAG: hypothetical protein V9G13_13950 [Marmoricola sp.]